MNKTLLQQTITNHKQHSITHRLFMAKILLLSLLILFIAALVASYCVNLKRLNTIEKALTNYQQVVDTTTNSNDLAPLQASLTLYRVYQRTYGYFLLPLGFYQGKKVTQLIIKPLLQEQIQQRYLPYLQQQLQQLLINAIAKKQHVVTALSTYLMLSEPHYYWSELIFKWLGWQQKALKLQVLSLEDNQILLTEMRNISWSALPYDKSLVEKAQQLLPLLLTQHIKAQLQVLEQRMGNDSLPKNIQTLLQKNTGPKISKLYTKAGYDDFVNTKLSRLMAADWIYQNNYSAAVIKQDLINEYNKQYITHWQNFIANIKFADSKNLTAAVDLAKNASKYHSAWQNLLDIVVDNTKNTSTIIEGAFANWAAIAQNKSLLSTIRKQFYAIKQTLQPLNRGSDIDKKVFTLLKQVQSKDTGIASFSALDESLQKLPLGLASWLKSIRQSISYGMLVHASQYISNTWLQQIVPATRGFMSDYPFSPQSDKDIEANEFTTLFGPKGTFDRFLQDYVAPFIYLTSGKVHKLYQAAIPLSATQKKLFLQIAGVTQNFFSGSDNTLKVAFTLAPFYLSDGIASTALNVLDQQVNYKHGPSMTTSLLWPTKAPILQAQLTWLTKANKPYQINTNGLWCWLQLLQQAKLEMTTKPHVWRITFHQGTEQFALTLVGSTAMDMLLSNDLVQIANDLGAV